MCCYNVLKNYLLMLRVLCIFLGESVIVLALWTLLIVVVELKELFAAVCISVSCTMLVVCYVLVALSCILSVVHFPVYDVRYDREGIGSEE